MTKNIEKENEAMNAFENTEGTLMDDFNTAGADADDTVDMDFNDVFEEEVHPSGTEVKLVCVGADKGIDKNGAQYWRLTYEDANNPRVRQIRFFLGFPLPGVHTVRQVNNKKKAFMDWKTAHGLPLERPVGLGDCQGLEAWAILRLTESEEYGAQNDVKRWITPRN